MIEFRNLELVGEREKLGNDKSLPVFDLVPLEADQQDQDDSFLDVPVFSAGSPIHTGEIDLIMSHTIAAYLEDHHSSGFTTEQRNRLTFLGTNPTCREVIDFVRDGQPDVGFVVPLPSEVNGAVFLRGRTFHELYAEKKVPVLDVHDVMLHSLQFVDMEDTLDALNNEIVNSYAEGVSARKLVLAHYALAEYTIISRGDDIISFGALNWQYFRKSHASSYDNSSDTADAQGLRKALRWNSIRAIASLARRSKEWGVDDVPEKLGYTLDPRIDSVVEPHVDLDIRDVYSEDDDPFEVEFDAPGRRELESNVVAMVDESKSAREDA